MRAVRAFWPMQDPQAPRHPVGDAGEEKRPNP